MNPIKLAITLPLALAGAAIPALAQAGPAPYNAAPAYGYGQQAAWNQRGDQYQLGAMRQQLFQLDRQISRAQSYRQLDQREAYRLRGDLNRLNRDLANATRGGLNRGEVRSLQARIDNLRQRVERQARDTNRPGSGHHRGY
jgi:hypothetical protein